VVPDVAVRAVAQPAAALSWAAVRAVPVRAAAAAVLALLAVRVEAVRLGAEVWLAALAAVVRPAGPAPVAVAPPEAAALVAASAAPAAGPGVRMRIVAATSVPPVPRRPVRAAEQAPANARPARLEAPVVETPAMPVVMTLAMRVGAENRLTAVAAAGRAIQRVGRDRRAGTAASAGGRALVAGPVPVGPRARRAARPGGRAEPVTSGERSAPGMAPPTRQPTGLRVPPLVSDGTPDTAAATAEAQGPAPTGRGAARLRPGAATVATTVTTDRTAIAAARGGTTIAAAATTPPPAVGRAARAARRPGRTGMRAARRAECPAGLRRPGWAGVRVPAEASRTRTVSPATATEHPGLAGALTKRG
jgi:hypothetical protein